MRNKIKEHSNKALKARVQEYENKTLDLSFSLMINDKNIGLPHSTHNAINDKNKIQKIVKVLMLVREQTPEKLIRTPKASQIGGCEMCHIDKWNWCNNGAKNFLKQLGRNIFIIRAGDSRIFGSFYKNLFCVHCIEYNLGDIYKH